MMICANPDCGKEFERKVHNQKYCSQKCKDNVKHSNENIRKKNNRHSQKLYTKCLNCGEDLINKRSDAAFCCKACKNKKWQIDHYNDENRKQSRNKATAKYYKNNQLKLRPLSRAYSKLWRDKNPEKVKQQALKAINELQNGYVATRLKREGFKFITHELIELKRIYLKGKRTIKQLTP